jgi:hypothetical protein
MVRIRKRSDDFLQGDSSCTSADNDSDYQSDEGGDDFYIPDDHPGYFIVPADLFETELPLFSEIGISSENAVEGAHDSADEGYSDRSGPAGLNRHDSSIDEEEPDSVDESATEFSTDHERATAITSAL